MAKRREIICDRCERVIANLNFSGINILQRKCTKIKWWQIGTNQMHLGQRIDLCADCENEFEEFLKRGNIDVTEAQYNL